DALGSVTRKTDALGVRVQDRVYEPFGESLEVTTRAPQWPQGMAYTGHVLDNLTRITYAQARYYDQLMGRFMSVDPVAPDAGSFNRYWYANNNPYNNIDPDGREVYDCRGKSDCAGEIKIADLNEGDSVITNGATVEVGKSRVTVTLNNKGQTGANAARTGPVLVPKAPAGVNVDKNIAQAGDMSPFEFRNHVKNKGPWDYKQLDGEFEPFGNFNYGATGRAVGFPSSTLLQRAGAAQSAARTSRPGWGHHGGWLPGTGSGDNGDDPIDQFWIQQGIRYEGR
ncbi:MAG TPA: RHS repeat-associated core domain-containing protein, partial [Dokdonella sp.]|uniref:RHS repeat-associated core domain-containing protein n=1 Tax=Dokdonella sp. TaxID=2291710 RepID=UPI002C3FDF52